MQAFKGRRIGLLGGSFNPAHKGHRAISLFALKRLGLDEIWWLVSPQNPLKTAKGMAPLADRLTAARQLASHPRILVTDIERQLGTRYTIDTLHALQRRFSHTRFVWLMGSDNLQQITRWRNWQSIFQSVPVAVFRRPAYAVGRKRGKAALRFDRNWQASSSSKTLVDQPAPAWLVLDNKLSFFSATEIRKDKPRWPKPPK
jgi:nicotinate-nucleotide adenylyltransferase